MKVSDIMTHKVVTCSPDTDVIALAQMMATQGISGVPVLSENKLVGIVSEGDLLRRGELGETRETPSWWLRLFGKDEPAGDYVKTQGRHVRDVMSREIVTIEADASLTDVAELFESRHIKRAPVLDSTGRLVGIISRANFVHAIANASRSKREDFGADDDSIAAALTQELAAHSWWRGGANSVTVSNGVVHFWGYYSLPEELEAARVAAENTAGVVRVEENRTRYPIAYA